MIACFSERRWGRQPRAKHIVKVMEEGSPENEWLPWKFKRGVPKGYWDDAANHVLYAQWLGEQLGYEQPEDWYQVSAEKIFEHSGKGLLINYYDNSPQQFVNGVVGEHLHPGFDWLPWLFEGGVRNGYWDDAANRALYAQWLRACSVAV